jgi:hypothetical protein
MRNFSTTLLAALMVVSTLLAVNADTEIRNFRLPFDPPAEPLSPSYRLDDRSGLYLRFRSESDQYSLDAEMQQLNLSVTSASPEKYIALSVDSDRLWTVRLSWPASVSLAMTPAETS